MKRLFSLLLTFCLLLAAVPAALAEPAVALVPVDMPLVGEVIYGFQVVETRDFPLVNAQIVRFEHQKTGAELYYIANDDTNRVFDLTFFTEAVDNTGLPHVFEHSTLDGSEKYPSKALFFNLCNQTYNTYINASTYRLMTTYPVASLSEAQLLKYADYYTDSCLHPMIMEDESIYREEAWRYRLADADAPLAIEGTVYSEMLGAITLQRAANTNALRTAYPGSTIGNDFGGEPEHIPEMTWQMLKDYHDRYYHPSNCAAYLYGEFEDYTAFLALLDEAFSPYEKREFTRGDEGYTPITEPVEATFPFPVEAGSSTDHASAIYYIFVCPGLNQDPDQEMLVNTLTDLLTDGASDLQQSLQEALPYGSFGCFIQTDAPDSAVVFRALNVNGEDAAAFKATVDAALARVAESGFPQEQVDGVMASLSISTLLAREAADVGVESVVPNMAYSYANSGNPWDYLDYVDALGRMDDWNQQGLYAQAVSDWLIDCQTTALVATYPEPGLKEKNDAALAERLAEVKAAMSDEEIAEIVAASNAGMEEDDASEYVAQLQAVTVDSLPEEIKLYDVTDETDDAGIRHIESLAGVDGIGHASIFLDASGLPQEDIHWFKLYTELTGELDTAAHTKAELARLIGRYLYDPDIYVSLPNVGDGYNPYMRIRWIARDEDLATGYDLMRELVFAPRLDDTQKILEGVQGIKAGLKNSITSEPYSVSVSRALARTSKKDAYHNYAYYLDYYAFLERVEQLLAEDPEAATAKLEGIRDYFNNNTNAIALYAGNAESIALNRPLADAFLMSLDSREIEPATYDFPLPAASEALVVDSSVQYNMLLADYETLGIDEFEGGLDAITGLVQDVLLLPQLRDQYGAYDVMHAAMLEDGLYVISYRDPNVAETFAVYDSLYDQLSAMEIDQDTLDGYILSSYAGFAMSAGELAGAVNAAQYVLEGESQEKPLEWMRQLKAVGPETLERYAGIYAKLSEEGVLATAGAASVIAANADLYEVILNPFGARDASQVELADVPEDHPQYEAVRYVFESGYMAPLTEDAFGVNEPATNGDLMTALYAMVGGEANPDDALVFFTSVGLASAATQLDGEATAAGAAQMMSDLATLMELEWSDEDAEKTPMTRGELAEMLMAFETDLG